MLSISQYMRTNVSGVLESLQRQQRYLKRLSRPCLV